MMLAVGMLLDHVGRHDPGHALSPLAAIEEGGCTAGLRGSMTRIEFTAAVAARLPSHLAETTELHDG